MSDDQNVMGEARRVIERMLSTPPKPHKSDEKKQGSKFPPAEAVSAPKN